MFNEKELGILESFWGYFMSRTGDLISNDPALKDAVECLKRDVPGLSLYVVVMPIPDRSGSDTKQNTHSSMRPRVVNGEIAPGTFSQSDEDEFRKAFKIKLN